MGGELESKLQQIKFLTTLNLLKGDGGKRKTNYNIYNLLWKKYEKCPKRTPLWAYNLLRIEK